MLNILDFHHIKKKPRNIFQNIPGVEIETVGFIQWLSLESKEPSFRRQKLERNHFLECVEFAELDLKSYTEEDEKEDEEMFQYLYLRYGTVFDNIADDLHEIQLTVDAELKEKEELEKARRRKKLLAPPSMEEIKEETAVEETPTVAPPIIAKPRTTIDRMKVFRDIFDIDKRTVGTKKPFATQFVENEPSMAIWLPFDKNIFGAVIPNDPAFHLQYDHILNILSKQNIKTFNEFQRLVVNLIQYPSFATQFVDNEPSMAIWLPFDKNIFGAVIP
uniref:Uncharacterized protein n=1 Tax=Panagrolaimus sp. ES5 TaxID=591445 RepID=A0AC34G9F8_9BILA